MPFWTSTKRSKYRDATIKPIGRAHGPSIVIREYRTDRSGLARKRMRKILTAARLWTTYTLERMEYATFSHTPACDTSLLGAYQLCFKISGHPDRTHFDQVKQKLTDLSNGIALRHAVKVHDFFSEEAEWALGYVKIDGKLRANGAIMSDIHLQATLVKDVARAELAVIAYLHEASHRFAMTTDYEARGYFRTDGSTYRQDGLKDYEAIHNADSYANFIHKVVELGNRALLHHAR